MIYQSQRRSKGYSGKQENVEATTRACWHSHLADASSLLFDGTVILCNEVYQLRAHKPESMRLTDLSNPHMVPVAASVDETGETPTSKEPVPKQENDDPVVAVCTDAKPPGPIFEIEGGPQSKLVAAPVQVDLDTLPKRQSSQVTNSKS